MDLASVLPTVLLFAMLAITASRTVAPFAATIPGKPVLEVKVGLLFRALAQRINVIAILAVLTIGGGAFGEVWISRGLFTITIVVLVGLILLPARYVFTTAGVSPNRATFRPWSDFKGWAASGNVVSLNGDASFASVRLYVTGSDRDAVTKVVTRFLGASGAR